MTLRFLYAEKLRFYENFFFCGRNKVIGHAYSSHFPNGHAVAPFGLYTFLFKGQPQASQTYIRVSCLNAFCGQTSQIASRVSAVACCSGVGFAARIHATAISCKSGIFIYKHSVRRNTCMSAHDHSRFTQSELSRFADTLCPDIRCIFIVHRLTFIDIPLTLRSHSFLSGCTIVFLAEKFL